jgi:selenocysteine lyase/cysteine desulfurase
MNFPIEAVRARFPALHRTDDGRPRVYFDAPGGTQVCSDALAAMTDAMSREAHCAAAATRHHPRAVLIGG